jgi:UDP-glucose 4-epimerase
MASIAVVTGGAGFIGSHVATALVQQGWHVRVLDSLVGGRWSNLGHVRDAVECIEGDLRDTALVQKTLQGASALFHKAAMVSVAESVERPVECHAVNGTGTLGLFDAARLAGVERIVFAASAAAYGRREGLPKRETDEPEPVSPYAATKLYGEHLCSTYTSVYGMAAFPLRYFNIYGPRQDPRGPYAAVISKFVEVMRAGRAPMVFGDGGQTRDFCFVGDVVQANLLALRAPASAAGQAINIGTGRQTSLLDLLGCLNELMGTSYSAQFGPERVGDIRHSLASIERARALLGYEPSVTLSQGLQRLLDEG